MPCSGARSSGAWPWQGWRGDLDWFGASPSRWRGWVCRLPQQHPALLALVPVRTLVPQIDTQGAPPYSPGAPGPRLPTPRAIRPSPCRPLRTPLRFSCSPSPPTDHRGRYYDNPWLNLNPPPMSCFSGGEEGFKALPWHPLGPGAGAGLGQPESPGCPCEGSPLLPPQGRCLGRPAAPRERCPQVLELSLGGHQALAGRRAGDAWGGSGGFCSPNPPAATRGGLVPPSLSPRCLTPAGVTLPLFSLLTV